MKNVLYVLVAVLASLNQVVCQHRCRGVESFSADTVDVVTFVPSRSYHDVVGGLVLYKNKDDDGEQVFDLNTGTVYSRSPDGNCVKRQLDDLAVNDVSRSASLVSTRLVFSTTDTAGVTRTGFQLTSGHLLVIRFLLNLQCHIEFISFSLNKHIRWAYFQTDFAPLTITEAQEAAMALARFEAEDCEETCV